MRLRKEHFGVAIVLLLAIVLIGIGVDKAMQPEPTLQERVERQQDLCPGLAVVTDLNHGDCLATHTEGDTSEVYFILGVLFSVVIAPVVYVVLREDRYRPLLSPTHLLRRR